MTFGLGNITSDKLNDARKKSNQMLSAQNRAEEDNYRSSSYNIVSTPLSHLELKS
jgi:hypothetical protein